LTFRLKTVTYYKILGRAGEIVIIGVPRELKNHEYRVSVTPAGVSQLVEHGHRVFIEQGAGEGSGFTHDDYRKAGGEILKRRERLFRDADIIVKVKEPLLEECELLHPQQVLFTYLHLAAHPALTRRLLQKKVTAIAYETLSLDDGSLPLLKPMSEIAGKLAVQVGLFYLQKSYGGEGILLSGVPGVERGRVTILGSGTVGRHAAQMAAAVGAHVTVLGQELEQLRDLDALFQGRISTRIADAESLSELLPQSDLTIGAVLLPGAQAPRLVTRSMVSKMKRGSVVVDVSIDQGGCFETSRPTTHSDPIYQAEGVIHYCVSNMPAAVPRTATLALSNVTLPYVARIASGDLEKTLRSDRPLRRGVNLYQGMITHRGVAEALGEAWESLESIFQMEDR
jgi:alanine dehydrogenase